MFMEVHLLMSLLCESQNLDAIFQPSSKRKQPDPMTNKGTFMTKELLPKSAVLDSVA